MASAINILDTLAYSISIIDSRLAKKEAKGHDFEYQFHEDGEFGWNDSEFRGDVLMTSSYDDMKAIFKCICELERSVHSGLIGLKGNKFVNKVTNKQFENFKNSINKITTTTIYDGYSYKIGGDGCIEIDEKEGCISLKEILAVKDILVVL